MYLPTVQATPNPNDYSLPLFNTCRPIGPHHHGHGLSPVNLSSSILGVCKSVLERRRLCADKREDLLLGRIFVGRIFVGVVDGVE